MVDSSFYNNKGPYNLGKISEFIQCEFIGDKDKIIYDIAPAETAKQKEICFISEKYKESYLQSKAGAFIITKCFVPKDNKNILISSNPHFEMAKVASLFYPESIYPKFFFLKMTKLIILINLLKYLIVLLFIKMQQLGRIVKSDITQLLVPEL